MGDVQLQITKATLGGSTGGMVLAPAGMTADQTPLVIQVKIVSGADATAVSTMKVWITDETGAKFENRVGLSGGSSTNNEPVWIIAVPKAPATLVLHFPSGETVDLTSFLE